MASSSRRKLNPLQALMVSAEFAMLKDRGMNTRNRRPDTAEVSVYEQAHLAPERYVEAGAEVAPPNRMRIVSDKVEERWTAVPAKLTGSVAQIAAKLANGPAPIAGWKVTQHFREVRKTLAQMNEAERQEHLQSVGVQTNDEKYSGFYATIPGNDIARVGDKILRGNPVYDANGKMVHDGVIRGGREIRGGKAEWRRALKETGCAPWDLSWNKVAQKRKAEIDAQRKEKHRVKIEKKNKLMPNKLGEV